MLPRAFHTASAFERLFADGDTRLAKEIIEAGLSSSGGRRRINNKKKAAAVKGSAKRMSVDVLGGGREAGLQSSSAYGADVLSMAAGIA